MSFAPSFQFGNHSFSNDMKPCADWSGGIIRLYSSEEIYKNFIVIFLYIP